MPTPRSVIVAGYGPVGRLVSEYLERCGVAVTLIEINPATVKTQTGLGRLIVAGDASDPAVLLAAGIEAADALILTMPDTAAALAAARAAHAIRPELFISARTNFVSEGMQALQQGADHVVVEELVTAEAMRNAVMQHFTLPPHTDPRAARYD